MDLGWLFKVAKDEFFWPFNLAGNQLDVIDCATSVYYLILV